MQRGTDWIVNSETSHYMTKHIKHIAFLKFKPACAAAEVAEVWRLIEALPKQIPGVLGLTWGPNLSTEGLDQGFTHSFVMVFESAAARDAYLPHPVHQAVVQKLLPRLDSVIVCDHEFEG
jgi:hypothetical protein